MRASCTSSPTDFTSGRNPRPSFRTVLSIRAFARASPRPVKRSSKGLFPSVRTYSLALGIQVDTTYVIFPQANSAQRCPSSVAPTGCSRSVGPVTGPCGRHSGATNERTPRRNIVGSFAEILAKEELSRGAWAKPKPFELPYSDRLSQTAPGWRPFRSAHSGGLPYRTL
jgi:hypothetical protein